MKQTSAFGPAVLALAAIGAPVFFVMLLVVAARDRSGVPAAGG